LISHLSFKADKRAKETMHRRFFALWQLSVILISVGVGLLGGILLDQQGLAAFVPLSSGATETAPNWRLLAEAWHIIQKNYVDRSAVQPRRLTYGAVQGMVDALGDTGHTSFVTPELVDLMHSVTEGQFEGIGAEIQMKDKHVVIVAPLDNSPAQQAGLRPGDIILQVNHESVTRLPLEQVVQRIRGPRGTTVTLTLLDSDTERARDVTVTRARVAVHNVTWQQLPGTIVAHVRIAGFSHGVTNDLQQALTALEQQGLMHIVLDLRNNPGGLLNEAVATASQFLSSGTVLLVRDAHGTTTPVPVQKHGVAPGLPLVVLINQGTASAAEIVAGALQDAHRAVLVGEKTFGTGTVLKPFPLSDGAVLMLAIEEWLTPNGRVIWHQGIAPDVVVSLTPPATPLLPDNERTLTAAQLQASHDAQLLHAVEVVTQASSATTP
jgi:carboxyl-terminal processing protease